MLQASSYCDNLELSISQQLQANQIVNTSLTVMG